MSDAAAVRSFTPSATKQYGAGNFYPQISFPPALPQLKNTAAADLYERVLTIQNAGSLEFPATDPANAAARDEFRLNTFPPDNHTPPAPSTPTPAPTPKP